MFSSIEEGLDISSLDTNQKKAYKFVEQCYELSDMPVALATALNDSKKLKELIDSGEDINKMNSKYETALDIALQQEDSSSKTMILMILKKSGALTGLQVINKTAEQERIAKEKERAAKEKEERIKREKEERERLEQIANEKRIEQEKKRQQELASINDAKFKGLFGYHFGESLPKSFGEEETIEGLIMVNKKARNNFMDFLSMIRIGLTPNSRKICYIEGYMLVPNDESVIVSEFGKIKKVMEPFYGKEFNGLSLVLNRMIANKYKMVMNFPTNKRKIEIEHDHGLSAGTITLKGTDFNLYELGKQEAQQNLYNTDTSGLE